MKIKLLTTIALILSCLVSTSSSHAGMSIATQTSLTLLKKYCSFSKDCIQIAAQNTESYLKLITAIEKNIKNRDYVALKLEQIEQRINRQAMFASLFADFEKARTLLASAKVASAKGDQKTLTRNLTEAKNQIKLFKAALVQE